MTSAVLAVVLVAANPPPPDIDTTPAPRSSAIVGGKHVQPRATNPDSTLAGQRGSAAQSDEVEQLYQQLMRETTPDASPKGTKPSQ